MTRQELGQLIHDLGADWAAHRISLATAIDRLRAAEPSLSGLGAKLQLQAWRTAPERYRPEPVLAAAPAGPRPMSEAALRRQPITFRFTRR